MIAHLWLVPAAIAQAAAPSRSSGGSILLFELALFVVLGYFFFMRPQQKQRKQHEEALRALKKGDEVVTAGGIVGEVIFMKVTTKDGAAAPSMDDRITIKSAESRIIVERGRIARVSSKAADSGSSAS